jgi:hypothetical protein
MVGDNNNCVELATGHAPAHRVIAIRDSKHPDGPVLRFTPTEFRTFLETLRG